jgi:MFS family permease
VPNGISSLPISIFVLGLWMGTLPIGAMARRLGRRSALQIGTACGVLTGLICCVAVLQGSFLLFNIGAVFSGFYAAAHQSYRFAAADTASEAFRRRRSRGSYSAASSPASSARSSSSPPKTCGRPICSRPPISASPCSP